MTLKEQIKAELERRIKLNELMLDKDQRPSDFGRIEEAKYLLRFVDRLPEGQIVAVEVVGPHRDLRLIDSTERCLFNAQTGDWLQIQILE